jgi:hypothetical protein
MSMSIAFVILGIFHVCSMDFLFLALDYIVVVSLLFGLVFTVGIIWRTEKKLDITYKFIFVALLAFLFSRVLALGYFLEADEQELVIKVLDFVGVFFLLLSILEMRDIVRLLDKEK